MGITESINYHLNKLELEVDEEDLANGSINPKYRTVRYWYDKWRSVNLGSRFGKGMLEKIQDKQPQYTGKGVTIKVEEDPFTAVIVTQIMRRAHILYCAGDIVFVESTESCDAENHSITFMLTVCSAGAVPLAVIINKGQSKRDYIAGFKMVIEAVGYSTFRGKGFPGCFMTDDSEAERQALNTVFPQTRLLRCSFYIAQSVWRWLIGEKNITYQKKIGKSCIIDLEIY